MSQLPVNATGLSRRELRKAVIRLRLEMQRQQLRRESQLLVQPFRQAQGWATTSASNCSAVAMRRSGAPAEPHCWAYCLARADAGSVCCAWASPWPRCCSACASRKAVEGCADRQRSAPSVSQRDD